MYQVNQNTYRPEIDGLRAVAVLLVIIYHAELTTFLPGGFIGVDIFFVISGFLITNIIYSEQTKRAFSLKRFYLRRIKRILPAFFIVCFITLLAGYFLLWPSDYVGLSKSFISTVFFVSNIYFWSTTKDKGGYFDSSTDQVPLLHTWSLSVEEQFYIFWPIALFVLAKITSKKILTVTIAIATLASFSLAEWAASTHAEAAYYWLPTRAGELLIGALIVFLPQPAQWISSNKVMRELIPLIAFLMLLLPAFILTTSSHFPGVNALIPCFGAALFIYFRQPEGSKIQFILSSKLAVGVGLISYSLYLWHWPIIAFTNYLDIEKPISVKIFMLAMSFVLSILSWRFIEVPFRRSDLEFKTALTKLFIIPFGILTISSFHIVYNDAYPGRIVTTGWQDRTGAYSHKSCQKLTLSNYSESCLLGSQKISPTFAIWGDSFADSYVPTISEEASKRDLSGYSLIFHSCPSINGIVRNEPIRKGLEFASECEDYSVEAYQSILTSESIDTVILTSAYNWYATASNRHGEPIAIARDTGLGNDLVIKKFVETANAFASKGKKVIILMPHYEPPNFISDILLYNYLGLSEKLSYDLSKGIASNKEFEELLNRYKLDHRVQKIYTQNLICPDMDGCRMVGRNDELYLSDGHHLAKIAVEKVVPFLFDNFSPNK